MNLYYINITIPNYCINRIIIMKKKHTDKLHFLHIILSQVAVPLHLPAHFMVTTSPEFNGSSRYPHIKQFRHLVQLHRHLISYRGFWEQEIESQHMLTSGQAMFNSLRGDHLQQCISSRCEAEKTCQQLQILFGCGYLEVAPSRTLKYQ